MIKFEANTIKANEWIIIILPVEISKELPSRGMVMVKGNIKGTIMDIPLEPDGMGSHWFRLKDELISELQIKVGDKLEIDIEPIKDWIEPEVPQDIAEALSSHHLEDIWESITTKARWEWIRWIRSTNNPETRAKRILVACSKLESGMKRPCCFDQTRCTDPYVSKSGILNTD